VAASQLLRFAATAVIVRASGPQEITTPALDRECLIAHSPLGAARAWYWRLTADERADCAHVVVSAWTQPTLTLAAIYTGPDVAFAPKEGWRELSALSAPNRTESDALAAP
jgi:hypothetical protein